MTFDFCRHEAIYTNRIIIFFCHHHRQPQLCICIHDLYNIGHIYKWVRQNISVWINWKMRGEHTKKCNLKIINTRKFLVTILKVLNFSEIEYRLPNINKMQYLKLFWKVLCSANYILSVTLAVSITWNCYRHISKMSFVCVKRTAFSRC